ncbi:MAG: hypothetical protein JO101_11545, partial [Candidatus Eremiobacteraeota bacterium]|nr:hypothetical protein [Candidatus Eremiobacteraeota bacterium]
RLLRELRRRELPVRYAAVTQLDARRVFGVAADAVLFEVDAGPDGDPIRSVAVHGRLGGDVDETWHVATDIVAADAALTSGAGNALDWRQGIKHDAAAIFELRMQNGVLRNGLGERVEVESDAVFPLVRARDLARGSAHDGTSYLLVPYRSLREAEGELRERAPLLHAYLERHAGTLAARRSSIYRNAARFALFGVGPYAFAPHKVAVSGLHREPRFVVLSGERPVQLSDTAYAAGFEDARDAHALAALLNVEPVRAALRSAIFPGKRPVTKRLLARLDLRALLDRDGVADALGEAAARRVRELLGNGPG